MIEAATLGGMWWHTYPHSGPILTVLSFAYGFLFGMGNMAFTRVKGWWPRMLLLTPFLLTVLVSQAMLEPPVWRMRIAYCILLGVGAVAFTRLKRPWQRILLVFLGYFVIVFMMLLCESVSHPGEPWPTFGLYFVGYGFGALLIACGLAGEAGRALRRKLSQSGGDQP